MAFCLNTTGCKSIDYGSVESCLLNSETKEKHHLIPGCEERNNEKWDYYELNCDPECPNEKPRPSPEDDACEIYPNICMNGGICESVQMNPPRQEFTYKCNCPCNWCGKHCEKCKLDVIGVC